jgi:uncharacterized protein (TIGR02118 family)
VQSGETLLMFKAIVLLTRKEGSTREEFRDWFLGPHAELVLGLPGLRGRRYNLVENESDLDGVAELWFDSQQAFEDAYATELGSRVAADSLAHVSRRERLFVTEHVLKPEMAG